MTSNDSVIVGAPFSEPRYNKVNLPSSGADVQVMRVPHVDANSTAKAYVRQIIISNNSGGAAKITLWDEDTTAAAGVKAEKRGSNTAGLLPTINVATVSTVVFTFPNLGLYLQQGLAARSTANDVDVAVFTDVQI